MSCTVVIKDKNLKPENIKKDITILKVKGTFEGGSEPVLQSKTVDVSTYEQVVTPDQGYDGLSSVTVNKVQGTYEINQYTYTQTSFYRSVYDKALVHYHDPKVATKTVDPSTSQQTFNPLNEQVQFYNGITVNAVDASIDSNIQAGNIKKDVTILGVTGTYESSPVQPVLQDASLSYTQNGTYTLNASSGYDGLGTVTVDVSVAGSGGSDWILEAKLGNITDLSGYSLPNVAHEYQYSYLFANTAITSTPDLSSITSITNQYACQGMFQNCSALTSVDLHNLTTVNGTAAMLSMFDGCTSLTTVDLSSLTSYSGTIVANSMFKNCNNLITLMCHPDLYDSNGTNSIPYQLGRIVNLTFTAMSTPYNNIFLTRESYLSAESVYSVLTHLNTSRGANCNFYSGGLTVTDYPDGRIQTAYDTAVAAGWTINNLTITPYGA